MSTSRSRRVRLLVLAALMLAACGAVAWVRVQGRPGRASVASSLEPHAPRSAPELAAVDPAPPPPERMEADEPPSRRTRVEEPEEAAALPAPEVILVRVVDGRGAPVPDVPLHVVWWDALDPRVGERFGKQPVRSGRDGLARFERSSLDAWFQLSAMLGDGRIAVGPDVPFDEPPRVELPRDLDVPGIPELRLPPFGWIEVRLEGEPPLVAPWITWTRRLADPGEWGPRIRARGTRLGPLGLGWTVRIGVFEKGRASAAALEEVEGPRDEGEVREVVLRPSSSFRIQGRLVDAQGSPWKDTRVSVVAHLADGREGSRMSTDAEGHFGFRMGTGRGLHVLEVGLVDARPDSPSVSVPVPEDFAPGGLLDVGTLVLSAREVPEPVVLAAGRVTDEMGRPLGGARVEFCADPNGAGRRPVAWARSDLQGRFEIRADELPRVDLGDVEADHACFVGAAVRARPGARDLTLVLTRGASLVVPLRLDEHLPVYELVGHLVAADVDVDSTPHPTMLLGVATGTDRQDELCLSFADVPPGEALLQVRVHGADWVLAERRFPYLPPEVTVAAPLDLRGSLRRLELRVLDEQGAPLAGRNVSVLDGEGRGYSGERVREDGTLRLLVPWTAGRLHVGSMAYEPVEIGTEAASVSVYLRAAAGR